MRHVGASYFQLHSLCTKGPIICATARQFGRNSNLLCFPRGTGNQCLCQSVVAPGVSSQADAMRDGHRGVRGPRIAVARYVSQRRVLALLVKR